MKKIIFLCLCLVACSTITSHAGRKYVGGDISLLTKYEEKGAIYYNENGARITNMLDYLNTTGLNAMRVRLFVDPSQANAEDQGEGVCQDLPFVLALSQRIKAAGFDLLLDIHYSDTWTDPGQHSTPASWTVASALGDSVYSYTKRVLNALIAVNAKPDFIQVGNEVTYGMLWPTGHCYPSGANYGNNGTFDNFANYLMQGIRACREVCPASKIVIHTEMGRSSNVISFYQTLSTYNLDYDIIGLSYYPYWHGDLNVLDQLLTTLENSYPDKKIQIVETGYPHAYYPSGASYDLQSVWPATEAGQKAFTAALVETLNAHSSVNGLYWWFPEANEYGINYSNHVTTDWYNCGWWDNQNGQVMDALFEMPAFLIGSGDDPIEPSDSLNIYIVGGEGNWSLTEPMGKMTNLGNGTYVDTLTISAPVYFVFADGSPEAWNNDWPTFNGTYRYGPTVTTTIATGTTYATAKRANDYSYYFTGDGSDYLFTFDLDNLTFSLNVIEPQPEVHLGDVNDDGKVAINDVTALIDYLLGGSLEHFNEVNADVNQDRNITISDVTALIDLLLSSNN
ncbi:MAG: glycosyl hydrolase 53 family protein [Muribaculaceae bacterium]|nr:glycosyl hydrolase 53 family protein [Muribaculaceae bacterium]